MAPYPLRQLISDYGLLAKKRLGQHFLIDPSLIQRIVKTVGNLTDLPIYEVGPGPGSLTSALLDAGARDVVAVEKDDLCWPLLQHLQDLSQGRLQVIMGDALKITPCSLRSGPVKIVSNLPYNVGTLLLIQWLQDLKNIHSLTLMFQKEVALRLVAQPKTKDYGRLSVLCQWLCDVKKMFDCPPAVFLPPPKVTSSVVHLRPKPLSAEEKQLLPHLEKITKAAFGQRRKMLRVSLKTLIPEQTMGILNIDPQSRPEDLTVPQFLKLAHAFSMKNSR